MGAKTHEISSSYYLIASGMQYKELVSFLSWSYTIV